MSKHCPCECCVYYEKYEKKEIIPNKEEIRTIIKKTIGLNHEKDLLLYNVWVEGIEEISEKLHKRMGG